MKSCALTLAFFLAGLLIASPGHAQINTYEEMKAELKAKGLLYKTFSADFTMDMELGMEGPPMTATGEIIGKGAFMIMSMESDIFMNMSIESDIANTQEKRTMKVIVDRENITWAEMFSDGMHYVQRADMKKDTALSEVSGVRNPNDWFMDDLYRLMSNPVQLLESTEPFLAFTLEGVDDINGDSVYVLNAETKTEGFQRFDPIGMLEILDIYSFDSYKMYIGVNDGFIRKLDVRREGEHMIQTYSNIRLNESISNDMFNYTPPADAEVTDMTEMMEAQIESMSSGVGENGKYHVGDKNLPDVLGVDLEGNDVKLSDYLGKVVLIDFWATWCPPCIEELPNVLDTYAEYKDAGLVILGVSLDNEISEITAFQAEHPDMTWVQICEEKGWESSIVNTYGVQAIPHTLLLDPNGTVAGADLKGKYLRNKIHELLNW